MVWYDMETGMPIPDGAQLSGTIQDAEHDEFVTVAGFSYSVAHKKLAHG